MPLGWECDGGGIFCVFQLVQSEDAQVLAPLIEEPEPDTAKDSKNLEATIYSCVHNSLLEYKTNQLHKAQVQSASP